MRKLILMVIATITLMACSKEEVSTFNYPMENLYGTWEGVEMKSGGSWIDLNNLAFYDLRFSIKFNNNGTYNTSGFFGTGSGSYEASGNTITTYLNGKKYFTYTIVSLSSNEAEAIIGQEGSDTTIGVRVEKK